MTIPFLGDALGGLAQGVGSALSARQQMRFQERMSSTAHQREVKDLRAAGLNPLLSAGGGPGASSPSGAAVDVPDVGASAAHIRRTRGELALMDKEGKVKDSAILLNAAHTDESSARAAAIRAEMPIKTAKGDAVTAARKGFGAVRELPATAKAWWHFFARPKGRNTSAGDVQRMLDAKHKRDKRKGSSRGTLGF